MGAGIIPFTIKDDAVLFLLHKTFSGRREGFLVDFGGGCKEGEDYRQTAVREFVEETETMYFEADLSRALRSGPRVKEQVGLFNELFEQTQSAHPEWRCRRAPGNKIPPKDWQSFFVQVPHRDLSPINREWELAEPGRFSKRRELFWVDAATLLKIYEQSPERLWKRVRQLEDATEVIKDIQRITASPGDPHPGTSVPCGRS